MFEQMINLNLFKIVVDAVTVLANVEAKDALEYVRVEEDAQGFPSLTRLIRVEATLVEIVCAFCQ